MRGGLSAGSWGPFVLLLQSLVCEVLRSPLALPELHFRLELGLRRDRWLGCGGRGMLVVT